MTGIRRRNKMFWDKYFNEKDFWKRTEMLQKRDRLSYDQVDSWLFELRDYLLKKALQKKQTPSEDCLVAYSSKVIKECKQMLKENKEMMGEIE